MVNFIIGQVSLECETTTDLFSPKDLDKGTRLLLEQIDGMSYRRALDWGCGWGAMALWLGANCPQSSIVGLDSDIGAVKVARANVERNQLANVEIIASHGFEDVDVGELDLVVSNPPTHRGREVVENMIRESYQRLARGGKLVIVVEARLKPWVERACTGVFGTVEVLARTNKHALLLASK